MQSFRLIKDHKKIYVQAYIYLQQVPTEFVLGFRSMTKSTWPSHKILGYRWELACTYSCKRPTLSVWTGWLLFV